MLCFLPYRSWVFSKAWLEGLWLDRWKMIPMKVLNAIPKVGSYVNWGGLLPVDSCWRFPGVVTSLLNTDQVQQQNLRQFNVFREVVVLPGFTLIFIDVALLRLYLNCYIFFSVLSAFFPRLAKVSCSLPSRVLMHCFWEGRVRRGGPGTKDSTWTQYRVLGSSQLSTSVLLVIYCDHWGRKLQRLEPKMPGPSQEQL